MNAVPTDDTAIPTAPLHGWRARLLAATVALSCAVLILFLLAANVGWRFTAAWGLAAMVLMCIATLHALGAFAATGACTRQVEARETGPSLRRALGGIASFWVAVVSSTNGVLPPWASAVLVPATAILAATCVFSFGRAIGMWSIRDGSPARPIHRRHGFWLVVLACTVALPSLGSFSLTDPWETHYGEVAREMLSRRDFISTWWAHQSWFMSKPVLTFWAQALSMSVFGVRSAPGAMLNGDWGQLANPEWALRMPSFLLALLGSTILYRAIAQSVGRWAGLLAGLAIWTAPQWLLISEQAVTDMVLVGPLCGSMGLFILALNTPPEELVRATSIRLGRGCFRLHLGHLVMAGVLACVVPQLLNLLSMHIEVDLRGSWSSVRFHADELLAGSPGNCGLAGQPVCRSVAVAHKALEPWLQAALWGGVLVALLPALQRQEGRRSILLTGAWLLAAVAAAAKGLVGIALPLGTVCITLAAAGRWRDLWRLHWVRGLAIVALAVGPWYLAMHARHGRLFIDELVLRHMISRTLSHLHDTNVGIDVSFRYYVWQLGYALFPWVGLAPAALLVAANRQRGAPRAQLTSHFLLTWFVLAFALVSSMFTKFHHYIFPAVPPVAALIGVFLSRIFQPKTAELARPELNGRSDSALGVLAIGGAVLVARVGYDLTVDGSAGGVDGPTRFMQLFTYNYRRPWPDHLEFGLHVLVATVVATTLTLMIAIPKWRGWILTAATVGSLCFGLWLANSYLPRSAPHYGQRTVMDAFYLSRTNAQQPLVAYQLNWKGENFYTGNHAVLFVSSGAKFVKYMEHQAASGQHVLLVALEHGRLATLRREVGALGSVEKVTSRLDSNQFCLARVTLYQPPTAQRSERCEARWESAGCPSPR